MKIISWNVNSVRKRLNHIIKLIEREEPDIICLQETKVDNSSFPVSEFKDLGYLFLYLNGVPAYNGVCIISKKNSTKSQIINFCNRNDARHINEKIDGIEINNIYIPAGGEEPDIYTNEKFRHKICFMNELISWSEKRNKRSIVLGDFNIAPDAEDVWSHKQLLNTISHTKIEREKIKEFLVKGEWTDVIKSFVSPPKNLFTWWSYRSPDYKKNNRGRRLDHFWITADLVKSIISAEILDYTRSWEKPSDHVPLLVNLKIN